MPSRERKCLAFAVVWSAGETIGERYKLERLIGEGGMGFVWAATHLITKKPVAIKALRDTSNQQVVQRFLREARAACAVRHPNVVEIHDVIVVDGSPVMVMDLLEGESLGQRVEREKSIPLDELATILLPVVSAVGAAHHVGIIHRDLKPDNVFLSRTKTGTEVKVLDFGIAKLTHAEASHGQTAALTGTGAILGTPYYMAPEQIFSEKDIDHRADIWAIGVMMYECLAGVRPTQADGIGQILKIVTQDGVKPLRTVKPDLPPDVLDLIDRMLTRERSKRPSSLEEVAAVLHKHAKGNVQFTQPASYTFVPATSTGNISVDGATIAASGELASTNPPVTTVSSRRPPLLAIAGGVLAVSVLGIGLFFAMKSGAHADPIPSTGALVSTATPTAVTAPATNDTPVATLAPLPSGQPIPSSTHVRIPGVAPKITTSTTASAAPVTSTVPTASATHAPGGVVEKPPF